MAETLKMAIRGNVWFYILIIASILLLVASFIMPPAGAIDPSVIAAVGELFAFGALGTVLHAIDKNKKATVTHGSTTLTVGDKD